jgi:hypothetical protein
MTVARRVLFRRLLMPSLLVAGAGVLGLLGKHLDWWAEAPARFNGGFRFADDFEKVATVPDLFPADLSGWHGAQREQPAGATPNQLQISTEIRHSGNRALKFVAAPYDGVTASKADIQLGGLPFTRGSEVWFSGWYFLAGGSDAGLTFLWDLEASGKWQSPGRRLFLQEDECLASDLGKWWGSKTVRQAGGRGIKFPKDQWVQLRVHLVLSERDDEGLIEVWQDGVKVLDAQAQTLPTAKTVYDRLQVGLTANGNRSHSQTLYLDDVILSNTTIPEEKANLAAP